LTLDPNDGKEARELYEDVAFESEYFRVYAGKHLTLQGGWGREKPSIPAVRARLREWKIKAAPILRNMGLALEKEMSIVQSSMRLPLLKYRLTTWTVFEQDIPEFVRTKHYGMKGEPFGYAIRFDEHGVQVIVVFSTLPEKNVRARLKASLESALKGVPAIPNAD
jgi:hypothetical protein